MRYPELDERKLLVRIAEMYYQESKTQSQISKELNIHRTTISRLLKQSRDEGIVEIIINYDKAGNYGLEQDLESSFGLQKAIVISTAKELDRNQKDNMLAKSLGDYLETILKDKMKIGFSWGETMAVVSKNMPRLNLPETICVPVIGGPAGRLVSDFHVNTITYEAAKMIHGKAKLIDAPAILETSSLKEELLKSDFNQEILSLWGQLDIVIMGIGSPILMNNQTWSDFYGKDIIDQVSEQDMVGDVVSRFYNRQGEHIVSDLDDRIIGISISQLQKCPYRIGIASSREKVDAIVGALKGQYINILVTTEETARRLIESK